jgi:hypothetical protein
MGSVNMAGFIKLEVEKHETQQVNLKIDAEIFEEFQKKCKMRNLQMCTVIETFARQYADNKFHLDKKKILKWKNSNNADVPTSTLNTPVNKEVYQKFKDKVKDSKLFVKHVLSAFIEEYAKNDYVLELTKVDKE